MLRPWILFLLCTAIFTFTGCGTAAHRLDPDTDKGIITVRDLDFKDYQLAAEDLITKLLKSHRIPRQDDGQPPIVMVSRIKNSTSAHLDVQLLTQKVTIALDQSQQARTTTRVYQEGEFDPGTSRTRELTEEEGFDRSTLQQETTLLAPRYSLSGEITELYRKQGRKQESYYQIYMTLTDTRTGIAIWQDANEIVKQEKRPLISL